MVSFGKLSSLFEGSSYFNRGSAARSFSVLSRVCGTVRRSAFGFGLLAASLIGSAAYAQSGPAQMPAIEMPVDTGSVVQVVAVAGGAILIAVFGVSIGFTLSRKLFGRVKDAV